MPLNFSIIRRLYAYYIKKCRRFLPFISVFASIMILLDLIGSIDIANSTFLLLVDTLLLAIFLIDYIIGFIEASNKRKYFVTHWIELVSLIPVYQFRALRSLSLLRVLRLVLIVIRTQRLFQTLIRNHRFTYITLGFIMIAAYGTIGIYMTEYGKSVHNWTDAIWWSMVTLTTVGYGDIAPQTNAGRFVAIFMMISGVGLLGAVTGTVSSYILNADRALGNLTTSDKNLSMVSSQRNSQTTVNRLKKMYPEIRACENIHSDAISSKEREESNKHDNDKKVPHTEHSDDRIEQDLLDSNDTTNMNSLDSNDTTNMNSLDSSKKIIFHSIENLSHDEITQVILFIDFIRSKKDNK